MISLFHCRHVESLESNLLLLESKYSSSETFLSQCGGSSGVKSECCVRYIREK